MERTESRTRNKSRGPRGPMPHACETCKAKKSACDRREPCGSCINRPSGPPCRYGLTIKEQLAQTQQRAEELERQVTKLSSRVFQYEGRNTELEELTGTPVDTLVPSLEPPSPFSLQAVSAPSTTHSVSIELPSLSIPSRQSSGGFESFVDTDISSSAPVSSVSSNGSQAANPLGLFVADTRPANLHASEVFAKFQRHFPLIALYLQLLLGSLSPESTPDLVNVSLWGSICLLVSDYLPLSDLSQETLATQVESATQSLAPGYQPDFIWPFPYFEVLVATSILEIEYWLRYDLAVANLKSKALLAYIRHASLHKLPHPPQSPSGTPLGDPIQYATRVALFWFAYVTTSRVLFLCEPYSQYHEFQVSEITTVLPVFLVDVRQMGWAAWDGRPHTLMELVYSPLEPTLLFNPFIRSILDRLMEREHCCLKFELPTQLPVEIFATLAQRLRNSPPPLFPVTPTAPSPATSLWQVLESLSSASPPYDPHSAVACLEAVNRAILLSQHSVVAHNVVRLTHPLILLGQLVEILRRNAFRLSSSTIASIVDSLTNIGAYMTSNLPSRIMAGNQSIPSTQEWKAAAVNIQAFLCMPTGGAASEIIPSISITSAEPIELQHF